MPSFAVLPVDAHIARIVETIRERRAAVIVAPPGSGKTTRVPPALVKLGRVILLQPRRVAARALARRIAAEQGWRIGEEIGWQIRFERRFSDRTRLLVATEGILTARLQSDPLLSDFDIVILDEFHERSIHADLALALVKQAAMSRTDLAVVVMSATIDAEPVAKFLNDAPVIDVAARPFPIEIRYRPGVSIGAAVREVAETAQGHILCFLPGAREIDQAAAAIGTVNATVLPLHGSLDVDAQERALAPSTQQKIILATNVAETSLTVEGVTDVIDTGKHKVLRYDTESAVDHLVTELISADSAAQRAGRAGRTAPGRATRLWDERMMLRPQREPDVQRIDLSAPVLDIIAWGGDPKTFEWFERPAEERIDAALTLLTQLGAVEGRRLTPTGEAMRRLPLHPRLARMVVEGGGSRDVVELAVEISEGIARPDVVKDIERAARTSAAVAPVSVARAALSGYPDRVAMRREKNAPRLVLATGTGATLAREIEHTPGEFFVVLDIRGELAYRVIAIERDWLVPARREITHSMEGDRVEAIQRVWYGGILLHEQKVPPDPIEAHQLMEDYRRRNVDPDLLRRLAFAGMTVDDARHRLDELAPKSVPLPSGRTAKLEYREDGSVVASVKLQELFGLADTPKIGPRQVPVTFALLAPNGRPVQVTKDLRSFWNTTYQEVRKELRGRYPKHPWPEDPWTAVATHRAKRRT